MKNKFLSVALLSLSLTIFSCKENTSKISDTDIKNYEVETAALSKLPKIEFDKTEHDFGDINEGEVVETEFIVKNVGQSDLIISYAAASCGCTVPDYPKHPIKTGETAPIKVSFNSSGKPGKQNKTVTLSTNTEIGSEVFSISANVKPKNK